jgi:hypothetical protein
MESRAFIKHATTLKSKIALMSLTTFQPETVAEVQRDLNQLFSGMQNPTLPSAASLCDSALKAGFQVDVRVQNRLKQAEAMWV